jgi:two-component system, OmpR family, KDP operon response regulator KdpE
MKDSKILVIDDDFALCQLVERTFQRAGAVVVMAHDGRDGVDTFRLTKPDLVILDVQMPQQDGWATCYQIRQLSDVPIIMVTALQGDNDIVRGLDSGADDFISKPFNPRVLVARAQAALRRSSSQKPRPEECVVYEIDHIKVDVRQRRVFLDRQQVKLTPKEFKLLVYLIENQGQLLTFDQILNYVWGAEYEGSIEYVHVYVSHLRRKLGDDPRRPRYIVSEHGVGYRFESLLS